MKTLELSAEEKRKSLILTVVIYALFLLILFFIRFWPPANAKDLAMLAGGGGGGGVTINFGNSDFGSGKDFQNEELNVKSIAKPTPSQSEPDEDIISEDSDNANTVAIPKKTNPVKVEKPKVKIDPKPVVETKPKVSKNTNDALSSILSGSKKGGDGDDSRSGNKGKTNGSLGSNDYYGSGGSGGGTGGGNGTGTGSGSGSGSGGGSGSGSGGGIGYSLGNRKALSKPQPKYTCNEQGNVAVQVTVDKNGNTIEAVPGVKGTTNTASCLLQQAKIAAMNTKWQASADAPDRQVGKIIYNFSLN